MASENMNPGDKELDNVSRKEHHNSAAQFTRDETLYEVTYRRIECRDELDDVGSSCPPGRWHRD